MGCRQLSGVEAVIDDTRRPRSLDRERGAAIVRAGDVGGDADAEGGAHVRGVNRGAAADGRNVLRQIVFGDAVATGEEMTAAADPLRFGTGRNPVAS